VAILLLCSGDEDAKSLLRQSIIAHYGLYPVGYESVRMTAAGRVKQKISRFSIWLTLKIDTYLSFPDKFRQDYDVKLWRLPLLTQSEAFDGQQHYLKNWSNSPVITPSSDPYIELVQTRLSAFTTMLLLPLNELHIQLTKVDDLSFVAFNEATQTHTTLSFYDNHLLKSVVTTMDGNDSRFKLDVSQDVDTSGVVKTFKQIQVSWNDELKYELYPTQFEFVDRFDEELFELH